MAMMEEATPQKCQESRSLWLDGQIPSRNHGGLTDFPVRNSPGVGHPVGDIGAPVPGAFRWRNGVEIGIGGVLCDGKTALLLTDLKAELGQASLEGGHATNLDRLDGGRGILLIVDEFVIGGCHGGRWRLDLRVSSQCARDVDGREDNEVMFTRPLFK